MCNKIAKVVNALNASECCVSFDAEHVMKNTSSDHIYMHIIYFLWSCRNVEMSTVCRQQHSLSPKKRMVLRKCWCFETENVSTQGDLEPPTFGFMPNFFPIFWNTGSGGINIFVCKVNIYNVNRAKATAFSLELISHVLVYIHVVGF